MLLSYIMVKYLGVKLTTVPLERVYFILAVVLHIYYLIFALLIIFNAYWRFKSINRALTETLKNEDKNILKDIKIIRKIWIRVEDLIYSMDKYFATLFVIFYGNHIVFSLTISFLLYDVTVHDLGMEDKIFMCVGALFCTFTTIFFGILIFFSNALECIINNAVESFNLFHIKSEDKNIQKSCELAILQFEHSRKLVSCGMFEFDWKLIFSTGASIFSNLITMIQFDYTLNTNQVEIF